MSVGELGKIYANGEAICSEGDLGEVMYVIQSGSVRITKSSPSGDVTLATLKSGDMFGEMALFDKQPRSATAVAVGEARVLNIDKKKLFMTISHDPTLVFKLLEIMSRRIRHLNDNVAALVESQAETAKPFARMAEAMRHQPREKGQC